MNALPDFAPDFKGLLKSLQRAIGTIDHNKYAKIRSGYCNWVIPGRVMCGPYPGKDNVNFKTQESARKNVRAILDDGINAFVCLQEELQFVDGQPPYAEFVDIDKEVVYFHFPVKDDWVPTQHKLIQHLMVIMNLLVEGKNVYIHCMGGHGRTGIYVACLLMMVLKISAYDAIYYTQCMHDMRSKNDLRCRGFFPCRSPTHDHQAGVVRDVECLLKFL